MKAMLLGVLLGLLLPAAGQAQPRHEALAAVLAGDTTKYVLIGAKDEPLHALFLDKTSLRSVQGRPRAWFINLHSDKEAFWLLEADCVELKLRLLAVTAFDLAGKRLDLESFSGPPLEWNFVVPGSWGEIQIHRMCR
jgi:hypothetical protein